MTKTFISFLEDKHAENYEGLDDEMSDDFDEWLYILSTDTLIDYADEYKNKSNYGITNI